MARHTDSDGFWFLIWTLVFATVFVVFPWLLKIYTIYCQWVEGI